jgi:hypothetical protein
VLLWVDYSLPLEETRQAARQIIEASPLWDRRFWNLQVSDTSERTMQIRVLCTAADASKAWDLRCEVREKLILFIQQHHPRSLPRLRADWEPPALNGNSSAASSAIAIKPETVVNSRRLA